MATYETCEDRGYECCEASLCQPCPGCAADCNFDGPHAECPDERHLDD